MLRDPSVEWRSSARGDCWEGVLILEVDRYFETADGDIRVVEGSVCDYRSGEEERRGEQEKHGAKVCPHERWRSRYAIGREEQILQFVSHSWVCAQRTVPLR